MRYVIFENDVWGNERDGFEVNDTATTGLFIKVAVTDTDKQIIQALKKVGILKSGCRFKSFKITGEPDSDLYISYRGRPILTLRTDYNGVFYYDKRY